MLAHHCHYQAGVSTAACRHMGETYIGSWLGILAEVFYSTVQFRRVSMGLTLQMVLGVGIVLHVISAVYDRWYMRRSMGH